jgi:hypothetical protein
MTAVIAQPAETRLQPDGAGNAKLLVFSLIVAAQFLLLTSMCSPLYAFNDWVDANAFLTMGKGLIKGLVPYRDLFEQKGPLLYLLHGLAYLVSHTTFLGVFFIEVAGLTAALFLAGKIIRLFVPGAFTWFIIPIFACMPLISRIFETGDSAEELCFPLIMALFYIALHHFKTGGSRPMPSSRMFWAGFTAGCVFMIKYTLLGYWIGFILVIILLCIADRKWRDLGVYALFFCLGGAAATLPWLVYFALNHALDDFLFTYLLINIDLYAKNVSLLDHIRYIGLTLEGFIQTNLFGSLTGMLGIGAFALGPGILDRWQTRILLLLCSVSLAVTVFFGARSYRYYFLAFAPLILFGLIALAFMIDKRFGRSWIRPVLPIQVVLFTVGMAWLAISLSPNVPLMKNTKLDYPQYEFAKIINQVPGATLLNYGFLDGGFYTAADLTPTVKYFMMNNISDAAFPELRDEQNRYIREKLVTFVVIRMGSEMSAENYQAPGLQDNYVFVTAKSLPYINGNLVYKYALYKVRDS